MGRVCREAQEWVEEQIEQPIETWENQRSSAAASRTATGGCLCLNKLVLLARLGCS